MDNYDKIREFIMQNFLFGDGKWFREDTSLMEEGVMDSTGILELLFFLEETFGISVEDEELVPENLDSLRNITRFINQKLGGIPTAEA